jgi:hypothetical protein
MIIKIIITIIENRYLNFAYDHFKRAPTFDQTYEGTEIWCHDRKDKPYFAPNGWKRYGFIDMSADQNFDQFRM